jgi:hypothetical protein
MNAPSHTKKKAISVRLSAEEIAVLDDICERQVTNRSNYLRYLFRQAHMPAMLRTKGPDPTRK